MLCGYVFSFSSILTKVSTHLKHSLPVRTLSVLGGICSHQGSLIVEFSTRIPSPPLCQSYSGRPQLHNGNAFATGDAMH